MMLVWQAEASSHLGIVGAVDMSMYVCMPPAPEAGEYIKALMLLVVLVRMAIPVISFFLTHSIGVVLAVGDGERLSLLLIAIIACRSITGSDFENFEVVFVHVRARVLRLLLI